MDRGQFRELLDRACRHTVESYKFNSGLKEKEVALAKLDGIFLGCLACAKALGEDTYEGGIMDIARELTEKFQREI